MRIKRNTAGWLGLLIGLFGSAYADHYFKGMWYNFPSQAVLIFVLIYSMFNLIGEDGYLGEHRR